MNAKMKQMHGVHLIWEAELSATKLDQIAANSKLSNLVSNFKQNNDWRWMKI